MDKATMKKAGKAKPAAKRVKKLDKMGSVPVKKGDISYVYRKDAFNKVKIS
tara:strand:- start:784 stop:936 length:153 start_codon:yes stop_codon:yes gene_type:complete